MRDATLLHTFVESNDLTLKCKVFLNFNLIKMTTTKSASATPKPSTSTTTRFKYADPSTDTIYLGEIEVTEETADFGEQVTTDITILSLWENGLTLSEVNPYAATFPITLRKAITQAALEQRMSPPETRIELPSDWDEIKIIDTSSIYTIQTDNALPTVETPFQRSLYGLKVVRSITPKNYKFTEGVTEYMVIAKGSIAEVQRELFAARIF